MAKPKDRRILDSPTRFPLFYFLSSSSFDQLRDNEDHALFGVRRKATRFHSAKRLYVRGGVLFLRSRVTFRVRDRLHNYFLDSTKAHRSTSERLSARTFKLV
jgi:hypothetical protein